jgi:3-ketosteroid 9alpha-monooxygenase subunit A
MVFAWYDRDGGPPEFDVPWIPPGNEDSSWSPWFHSVMRITTHSREIVVDIGHFQPVHGTHVDVFENEFTDERAIQRSGGIAHPRAEE